MIIVLSCFQLFHFGDAYPNYEELCRYDKCNKYVCEPWLRAIIGAVISWRIYNIQKKTSMKQDETLRRINELEESHDRVLDSIQYFQQHQEKILNKILSLEKLIL